MTSTGRLGIGTDSPSSLLDLSHSAGSTTKSINLTRTVSGNTTATNRAILFDINKTSTMDASAVLNYDAMHIDFDDSGADNGTSEVNLTGLKVDVNSDDATGTTKNVGIHVTAAGADTNLAGIFSGNVAIGRTTAFDANTPLSLQTASDFSMLLNSTNDGGFVSLKIGNSGDTSNTSNWDIVRANGSGNLGFRHWDTFYSGGNLTTVMQLDKNCRISLSNNDGGDTGGSDSTTGNTLFGYLAGNSIGSGSVDNIFIGHHAGSGSGISSATSNVLIGGHSGQDLTSGDSNTSIGYNSGRSISSGQYNVFLGERAGHGVTQRSNNVYIGYKAGELVDGAGDNVAVGYESMKSSGTAGNNTSQSNVSVGSQSGFSITTGDHNVSIGYQSGYSHTTAGNNVSVGSTTMALIGAGSQNTAIGHNAMTSTGTAANNDASNNVAVGYSSLAAITDGDANVALGYRSLKTATTAAENVAIGRGCMEDVKAAVAVTGCVAVGRNALLGNSSNNTGINHTVAVGYGALQALTTGGGNIAMGYASATALTAGTDNIAIGYAALMSADGAEDNNIVIGTGAGQSINNDASDDNVFIGTYAGKGGTGALADCVAIGYLAMDNTGSNAQTGTIAIGSSALTDHSSIDGAEPNTAVGYQAGFDISTGGANTILGYQALWTSTQDSCNTAIGKEALKVMNGSGAVNAYNTALGYRAGDGITTGVQNTGLGAHTAFDVDANNQTAIGYTATTASTGANTVMIGNSSVTDVYMGDDGNAWSQVSDERLKRNIEDWNVGLDAINKLNIKQFQFKKDNVFGFDPDKVRQGIIAQEAIEALPEMVKTNSKGWMTANNESMIWAMVNSIQELSTKVEELEAKLSK
tara:strand:+ start:1203 stop:3791 length:2589 start_codon:yes stop_codon:yes gene_type:complete